MLKQDITYNDIDGNAITEAWYFNLSEAEIGEQVLMEGEAESYVAQLREIIASGDPRRIIQTFKKFLMQSVGKRGDNNKFIKTDAIAQEFASCGAYHALLMDMVTNAATAALFVNNVFPKPAAGEPEIVGGAKRIPIWIQEDRDPTSAEMKGMSKEDLVATYNAALKRAQAL